METPPARPGPTVARTVSPPPDPPASSLGAAEARVAELEAELGKARQEARTNLLKGALVLQIDGRTPEQILEAMRAVEPTPGTVRFASNPEQIAANAWMNLSSIVEEDFEEALRRCLDHDLAWTARCDLGPGEIGMVREYTERAYRLMVESQRRKATVRRLLADKGALTPEERTRLEGIPLIDDHRVYVASWTPGFVLPLLFPKK